MQERFIKAIAGILVIILLCSSSGITISYAVNELLTDSELESQNTGSDKNVDFDIYYESGKHTERIDIDANNTNNKLIKVKINLKNIGYIEDGVVDFSNSNFKIINNQNQEIIKEIKDNKLYLNRLTGGEETIITLQIIPNKENKVSSDFFNKDNNIEFIGTFINENEKASKVNNNIILHTQWIPQNIETYIDQSITKYVPFNFENEAGVLLQLTLNTGIKDNIVPMKASHIEIQIPKMADQLPQKVDVAARSISIEGIELNKENWNYNADTGILTIDIKNAEDEQGKISWKNNISDVFDVICIYSRDVLQKVYETGSNVNLNTKAEYQFYGNDTQDQKQDEKVYYVKDQIGSLIDVTSTINTQKINKGYMYTNKSASDVNKNETIYNQKYELNISDINLVDEIILNQGNDIFANEYGLYQEGSFKNKEIEINKKEFEDIFGENGSLLLNIGEDKVYINSENEADNDGKIKINLEDYTGNIGLTTSKPVKVGTLKINITKAISKDQKYSLEELKTFKELHTNTSIVAKYNNNEVPVNKIEGKAELEEPTSKVTASINKENFSTVVTNENVEIKAILETNSIDDILYKNPTMLIAFPSYVNKIDITNCKSLYSDEIKISSTEIRENQNRKVLVINFEGVQTLYNDETTKGINVVLNANIEVDRLTPSANDKIEVVYVNENDATQRNIEIPVKFVAPVGLVTVNELRDFEEGKPNLVLVNENDKQSEDKAIISTYVNQKTANVKGTIINNYNNSISNMSILGSVPNTDIPENTFNAELQDEIKVSNSNAKIYYSANAGATADLASAENGWVEGKVNYKNVKRFLIVLNDTLEKGSKIEFEYPINIPSGLSFNNETKLDYAVTYNNNDVSGVKKENKNSGKIIITTGAGPNLEVEVNTDEAINGELKQGQYVRFSAKVKNIGTDATGVKVAIDETYGKVKKYNDGFEFEDETNVKEIGDLKAGESRTINYILQVKEDAEIKQNAEFKVGAVADRINNVITGVQNIKITKGKILLQNIIIASKSQSGVAELIKGENGSCGLYVRNISGEDLENVTVRYQVGNEINIKEVGEVETFYSPFINSNKANISEDKHTVTYVIDKINANETKMLRLNTEAIAVGNDVTFKAGIIGQDQEGSWSVNANTQTVNIKEYKMAIKSLQIDSKNQERKTGEQVTYLYAVKNTGDLVISIGKVSAKIPNGLTFNKAEIASKINDVNIYNERIEEITEDTFEYEKTFLEVGEELIIQITATVDDFSEEEKESGIYEKELSMKLKFTAMGIEKESDPEIYYAVCEDDKDEDTYKISGKVWNDGNKNSKKDEEEAGLGDIVVALFDKNTMKIAKDSNGEDITTKTLDNGSYEFAGLTNGKYLVAYLYNNEDYELAQYQKDEVLNSQNSDAATQIAKYNGEDREIALTDVVAIENSSERNIDLGLIEKDKFKLSLVKEINKITLNENGKVKETSYEEANKQLAKVQVKDNDNSKMMIAEYKVTIKNDGNVPGYANKVVSYLADDMKFNSELNPDWYLGEDGNVYSTSLANYELQAGETKELKLILTKNIDNSENIAQENKEIINNKSEISEEYNEKGIENVTEYNAKERNATASIEVVRGNSAGTILIIALVVIAITISTGSIIYVNKESIYNNKMYIRIKEKVKTKIRNLKR